MIRGHQVWMALFALSALMVLSAFPSDCEATDRGTYRVHGQVIAVNIVQAPHMIVIRTPLTKQDDMTVGAKVTAQTKIVRKGTSVSLQTIKMGKEVWLTYIKQRDGVFARTIQIH